MHVAYLHVTNRGYIDSAGCVASNDWTMRRSFPWLASLARSLFIVSQSPANTFVSRCTFLTGIRDNTTRSDRYVPNNLFAEYCDPGLIVPCKQCFSLVQTRQKASTTRISRDLQRSLRQSGADISGLYFRSGLTRHGSTVAVSLPVFRSLFPISTAYGIKPVKVKTQLPPELNKAYLNERHNRPFYFA